MQWRRKHRGVFFGTPRRIQVTVNVRFGSKADICSAPAHVCFVPKADISGDLTDTAIPQPLHGIGPEDPLIVL